jgi:hypothetical protein
MLDWLMQVNTPTLLRIFIVDTSYLNRQCTKTKEKHQQVFYSLLTPELIDNKYNTVGSGGSGQRNMPEKFQEAQARLLTNNGLPRCESDLHIMPTKRKQKRRDGTVTKPEYISGSLSSLL